MCAAKLVKLIKLDEIIWSRLNSTNVIDREGTKSENLLAWMFSPWVCNYWGSCLVVEVPSQPDSCLLQVGLWVQRSGMGEKKMMTKEKKENSATFILRTEQACKYWFPKIVQDKKVILSALKTLVPCWGSVKLFQLRYLCVLSQMLLPHIPKGPCYKWHMKIDCWVSAWLTGLCRQGCEWKWLVTTGAAPVHWNIGLTGQKGCSSSTPAKHTYNWYWRGKSDRLILYKIRYNKSHSL